MACGETATGSDGGSWSLRKSGLFVFAAFSAPKASTHVLAAAGYEFANASSMRQRQS
ncbi:hypothetical protein D3C83_95690 [compost metagenome]